MKHSRISLLERAAEVYDFGSLLRAPAAPAPVDGAEPVEPVEPIAAEPAPRAPAAAPPPAEAVATRATRPAAPPKATSQGCAAAQVDRLLLEQMGYIVPEAPVTGLAEEFRLLKHQVLAEIERQTGLPEEKRKAVLICSGQPREGKSFCAVNLALSLAGESDLEVLLVDGDFAKPDVLATLGIEDGPGLVDILADPDMDPESCVIRTDVPGLSVLPAGRKENNVPELLTSERTRDVLARLIAADRHRIILFDSPPALMASPASVLASHVGQALVVVRADQTVETDLRETVALLSGCPHVALVLNGAALAVSGRKYGAYDGYGHVE